uniref:Protein twisted gastrulation n=1 Tax=Glossina morsitans morsitans TaxID=37546 RepID=A0A1B0FNQ1_GLOMM
MWHKFFFIILSSFTVLMCVGQFKKCNEYTCTSVVSKCQLMQDCQCDFADVFCTNRCLHCLGAQFLDCCSCLKICPTLGDESPLAFNSQTGYLDGIPTLFNSYAAEKNDVDWTALNIPVNAGNHSDCVIIFLNNCYGHRKCMDYCSNLGADSYRWFLDGCCECVGVNCFNYGLSENHCSDCPTEDDIEDIKTLDGPDDKDEAYNEIPRSFKNENEINYI